MNALEQARNIVGQGVRYAAFGLSIYGSPWTINPQWKSTPKELTVSEIGILPTHTVFAKDQVENPIPGTQTKKLALPLTDEFKSIIESLGSTNTELAVYKIEERDQSTTYVAIPSHPLTIDQMVALAKNTDPADQTLITARQLREQVVTDIRTIVTTKTETDTDEQTKLTPTQIIERYTKVTNGIEPIRNGDTTYYIRSNDQYGFALLYPNQGAVFNISFEELYDKRQLEQYVPLFAFTIDNKGNCAPCTNSALLQRNSVVTKIIQTHQKVLEKKGFQVHINNFLPVLGVIPKTDIASAQVSECHTEVVSLIQETFHEQVTAAVA